MLHQYPTLLARQPESLAQKAALIRGILAGSGIPSWQAAAGGPWTVNKLRTWLLFSEGRIMRLRYLLDAGLAHECPSPFKEVLLPHAQWATRFPGFAVSVGAALMVRQGMIAHVLILTPPHARTPRCSHSLGAIAPGASPSRAPAAPNRRGRKSARLAAGARRPSAPGASRRGAAARAKMAVARGQGATRCRAAEGVHAVVLATLCRPPPSPLTSQPPAAEHM
ncbi:MAG: hypothetical protein J3K34DRAFT_415200 [Monoraphidium minutum]|nr:MAG: hypothetical protein J3K34DRAFT_415200 [Monoraphidium minutum]